MTPALLAVVLQNAPALVAQLIVLARHHGLNEEANQLEAVLRRSDANADQLIADALAAGATPPADPLPEAE